MNNYGEYYVYLEALQESGKINMFEAPRLLQDNFELSKEESFAIFSAWATIKEEQAHG